MNRLQSLKQVVDLLIRRLENESNNRRRVDLIFLWESITQCSHSQKGIAGAPYIPAVQAVLPRLFSAVVPPGIGAWENRRQCLKVLRLWLERKIFPESVLRRFMDDIEGTGGDTKSVFSSRRPSRSERGVDDLLREIGTIEFDEYGRPVLELIPVSYSRLSRMKFNSTWREAHFRVELGKTPAKAHLKNLSEILLYLISPKKSQTMKAKLLLMKQALKVALQDTPKSKG